MSRRQRVLFSQLQLAGLGVVLLIFGWAFSLWPIAGVGVFLILYGIIRFFLFRRLTSEAGDEDLPSVSGDAQSQEQDKLL